MYRISSSMCLFPLSSAMLLRWQQKNFKIIRTQRKSWLEYWRDANEILEAGSMTKEITGNWSLKPLAGAKNEHRFSWELEASDASKGWWEGQAAAGRPLETCVRSETPTSPPSQALTELFLLIKIQPEEKNLWYTCQKGGTSSVRYQFLKKKKGESSFLKWGIT